LRGELLPCQDLLALVLKLIKGNLVLGLLYLRLHLLVIGFERGKIVADHTELGLRLVQFQLKGQRVEPKQNLPRRHVLVVPYFDRLDHAGHIGRKADFVGLDIGVVSRHIGASLEVEIGADHQHNRQQQKQRPAQPAPA
jgi:hypothetical protein